MEQPMAEIGIVIRTFNEADLLSRTLDAVLGQNEQSFEVVLIDSGSQDKTLEIASRYNQLKIIKITNEDFTYGKALNLGISALSSQTKYIAMLSAHAIPCNQNWLNELILPMKNNPEIAGVYGKQTPLPEHMSNPVVRALATEAYPNVYGNKPFCTNNSSFFSNANSAIRFCAWKEHKFDESLPYCEDQKWAMTIIKSGKKLAYQPSAELYHSHPDTYSEFYRRRKREETAFKTFDSINYPVVTNKMCLKKTLNLINEYANGCKRFHSLSGLHLDLLLMKIIVLFASYKGRRHAGQ
jgi:rhamnosyltransferase